MPLSRPAAARRVPRTARRRAPVAVAAVVVVLTGLAVSRGDDLLADLAGGALYAALVQLLVVLVVPAVRTVTAAVSALGVCAVVELAQLTPVPAAVVGAWPPAAYVLGSTFVPTDLLAYAAGVVVVTAGDTLLRRRRTAVR